MRVTLLCLGLLTGCSAPRPAPADVRDAYIGRERRQQTRRIDVELDGVDLATWCRRISARTGRRIVVDPNVQETVTVSLREIPWREAVDVIAKMTRCEVEERDGVIRLHQDCGVILCADDANVRTLLQLFAAYTGRSIVLPADVGGTVSLTVNGTGAGAMQRVLDVAGLHYDVVWGDPVRLKRRPPTPLRRRLIELR